MTLSGKALKRNYLDLDFSVSDWEGLLPLFQELKDRRLLSVKDLESWIADRNELEAVVDEDSRWRYIRLSVDNNDKEASDAYQFFVEHITPKLAPFIHDLNLKLVNSPFLDQLDQKRFYVYLRAVKGEIELFRPENIPLFTDQKIKTKQYGSISAEMTISLDGEELTMQQASVLLLEQDRALREKVYRLSGNRRLEDAEKLDDLFSELVALRQQIALNAGFENYRDFKFAALGRFDYSPEDCMDFHDAIASSIVPLIDQFNQKKKEDLHVDTLKPWDLALDSSGKKPLKPYSGVDELIEKSVKCLNAVNPFFGECLEIMRQMKHLDLDSRKGKRPGGYNMTLPETGVPFIFMNSADSLRDMRTMMHEGGHAVHSFLTRDLPLNKDKRPPSEVAEMAAMAMEMLSMDHWGIFFKDEETLRRAKLWQLQRSLELIPWIATIDKFQHWIYTNPDHSVAERDHAWLTIFREFDSEIVSWETCEDIQTKFWHRQLHLFEVPFYYIEYGIAQLAAIAIWKEYKESPQDAVNKFIAALKLGYSKPIREIYKEAGIRFDFSAEYISELADFMGAEIEKLL